MNTPAHSLIGTALLASADGGIQTTAAPEAINHYPLPWTKVRHAAWRGLYADAA